MSDTAYDNIKTDLDLPLYARTQSNLWQATYYKSLRDLHAANKGIARLKRRLDARRAPVLLTHHVRYAVNVINALCCLVESAIRDEEIKALLRLAQVKLQAVWEAEVNDKKITNKQEAKPYWYLVCENVDGGMVHCIDAYGLDTSVTAYQITVQPARSAMSWNIILP